MRIKLMSRVGKSLAWGGVKRLRTDKRDASDPRNPRGSLKSGQPDPEEGRRLVAAFLAIKDPSLRRAVIEFTETLAWEKA